MATKPLIGLNGDFRPTKKDAGALSWFNTGYYDSISAAKIKTGPSAHFGMFNPAGAADATKIVALPFINVLTGDVFDVAAGKWSQVGIGGVGQGAAAWP